MSAGSGGDGDGGRVVLARLADELGLSIPTVSRALRGIGRISAATRRRVAERAAALGYRPRLPAVPAAAVAHPHLVAIAQPLSGTRAPSGTWPRVEAALARLRAAGHDLELVRLGPRALERWIDERAAHPGGGVDGVLLLQRHEPAAVARLAALLPVASLIFDYPGVALDVAAVDDEVAGRLQAEHLLALGHRRIGWLAWELGQGSGRRRLGGFLAALACAGAVPRRRDLVLALGSSAGDARDCVARALRRTRAGVTAWGCSGDHMAHRLLAGLSANGLTAAVTGVDNLPPRAGLPAVTSVRIPVEEVAVEGVAQLLRRIARPGGPPLRVLAIPALVPGSTSIPPPAGPPGTTASNAGAP